MDFDVLFPNRFMKAGEFNGKDVTFKISSIVTEELEGVKGVQTKGIIQLEGQKKQWVLNKTNGLCLKQLFGRETAEWVGKRVTLFPAEVRDPSTGDTTLAIRVRGSPDMKDAVMEFTTRLGKANKTFKLVRTGPAPRVAATARTPDASAARRSKIWERAKANNISREGFPQWVERQLGSRKAAPTWTAQDCGTLEEALDALEQPPTEGMDPVTGEILGEPPPDVVLPTPDTAAGEGVA